MKVRFEEKEFEHCLNLEISRKSHISYAPGQVAENILGFDASFFSRNNSLWRQWNIILRNRLFLGIPLQDIAYEMERYTKKRLDSYPQNLINVLIQIKRPEYLSSNKSKEWNS
jgi:hypothetical protein